MKDSESLVKVLHIIGKETETSQSNIAKRDDISVGKVNYIIKALIEKGIIKTENFLNSKNKWAYRPACRAACACPHADRPTAQVDVF